MSNKENVKVIFKFFSLKELLNIGIIKLKTHFINNVLLILILHFTFSFSFLLSFSFPLFILFLLSIVYFSFYYLFCFYHLLYMFSFSNTFLLFDISTLITLVYFF
jgi:hypothetical protein